MYEVPLRDGHILGAANIPWGQSMAPDGTFKSGVPLKALYDGKTGRKRSDDSWPIAVLGSARATPGLS